MSKNTPMLEDPVIAQEYGKVKELADLQDQLEILTSNSTDEEIQQTASNIPQKYLSDKDKFKIIIGIIIKLHNFGSHRERVIIKLLEYFQEQIEKLIDDKILFFFHHPSFVKFWLYKEEIIELTEYALSRFILGRPTGYFFLPEVYTLSPDLFQNIFFQNDKPLDNNIKINYTEEELQQMKQNRLKYFEYIMVPENNKKSIKDSNNEIYLFETDPVRRAIYADDVNQFQNIVSQSNLPIDSEITSSSFENIIHIGFFGNKTSIINNAILHGSFEIFKYLLVNGAKIDTHESIFSAIYCGNLEIFHILENQIKDKKELALTTFQCSLKLSNKTFIEYSICNYSDLFSIGLSKKVIEKGFVYLNFGIFLDFFLPFIFENPNITDEGGRNTIFYAIGANYSFLLNLLLRIKGTNIDYVDPSDGSCALTFAVMASDISSVKILLAHNCNVNIQDKEGFTPLMRAIVEENFEIVKLLCEHNQFRQFTNRVNINLINHDNICAVTIAAVKDKDILCYLLKKYDREIKYFCDSAYSTISLLFNIERFDILEIVLEFYKRKIDNFPTDHADIRKRIEILKARKALRF